ncbi:MAG: aminotransferase class V-fold PLP-dependent enzyme [Chloroflexi bacterium]|nr:aminotransferase class V-fold PLP-dependent enzyme [Chloroflexota bacterium]
MIYFDNAATSWPKPAAVKEAVLACLEHGVGNPGRAGHRLAIAAGRVVLDAREAVAELLGVADPSRIVFTKNATEALNLAIYGLLRPHDHVITSGVEHNSVMRPLRMLEDQGLELTVVRNAPDGSLDPEDVRRSLRSSTRLLVTAHASNVLGTLLPIGELAALARQANVPYLVDIAQTAGTVPIDAQGLGLDLVAFTGHKGLFGPTGTGGLYVREGVELEPLLRGGTGSYSELERQPDFLPDRFESGTLNVLGLAGLAAGVRHVLAAGVCRVRHHEVRLIGRFLDGLRSIGGAHVQGPADPARQVGIISFTIDGLSPSDIGFLLDHEFGIMSRVGLHCAPAAHRTTGTYPVGTVRFSFGLFNTEAEVDLALRALEKIASASGS